MVNILMILIVSTYCDSVAAIDEIISDLMVQVTRIEMQYPTAPTHHHWRLIDYFIDKKKKFEKKCKDNSHG